METYKSSMQAVVEHAFHNRLRVGEHPKALIMAVSRIRLSIMKKLEKGTGGGAPDALAAIEAAPGLAICAQPSLIDRTMRLAPRGVAQ